MKKKILLILMLIAITTVFAGCGCGSTSKSSGNKKSESSRESEEDDDDDETALKSWLNQFSESETAPETDNVPEENDVPEANVTPETDTVPETVISSESEPASGPEVESSSEEEPSSEPESSSEPELSPEELAAAAEAEKAANILSCMEATFFGALDHIVPEKDLDSASKVSNAILLNTTYSIESADESFCTVTVRYPNVATALTEALSILPAEATEEQTGEMLENLAKKIENQEVEMIEKTFTAEVVQADDMYTIKWTTELYDAFTGGLYSIE